MLKLLKPSIRFDGFQRKDSNFEKSPTSFGEFNRMINDFSFFFSLEHTLVFKNFNAQFYILILVVL